MKELLESRRELFSPQALTIGRVFEFLSAVPAMERAGVIVSACRIGGTPLDRPAHRSAVRVGNKPAATFGAVEALDFKVEVAIDGEPLSAAELAELMKAREGMTLLRGKWVQVDPERLQSAVQHRQTARATARRWSRFPGRLAIAFRCDAAGRTVG